MKLIVAVVFLATILLASAEHTSPSPLPFEGREVENEVILTLAEPTYEEIVTRFGRADLGAEVSTVLPGVEELRWILSGDVLVRLSPQVRESEEWKDLTRLVVIKLSPPTVPSPYDSKKQRQKFASAKSSLEMRAAKPGSVRPNGIARLAQFNDPLLPGQMHYLSQIGVTSTWGTASLAETLPNKQQLAKKLAVVVVDTGVDCGHQDLLVDIANSKGFGNNEPCVDFALHGTLVAAVAAAKANNGFAGVGVAAGFPVVSFRIFRQICSTDGKECIIGATDSDTAAAFLATTALPYDRVIATASFYLGVGGESSTLREVIWAIRDKTLVVPAAANDSMDIGENPVYPCSFSLQMENVICVGATGFYEEIADFSNRGKGVDIAAPGVGVLATTFFGKEVYASGTSFSAPFVAGAAILAASSTDKLLSPAQLKQALLVGARFNPMLVGVIPVPRQLSVPGAIAAARRIANGETLTERSAPPPSVLGVTSIFGQPGPVAPGEWVSIYGSGFAEATTSVTVTTTQMSRLQVWFGTTPALLGSVSPTQINAIVPPVLLYPPEIFGRIVVVRLDETGSPIMDSATLLKFNSVDLNPSVVGLVRAINGSFVGDTNPVYSGEILTLLVSGIHKARQFALKVDGQVIETFVEKKWDLGVTSFTFPMPSRPGPNSFMVNLTADDRTIGRGFNYSP